MTVLAPTSEKVTTAELVKLCAVDPVLFSHTFFPKTCRQATPAFHRMIWQLLMDPNARYVSVQIFRDAAKTSLFRLYMAWLIAYGFVHTGLYIGKSESHARRSIAWLRRQVTHNVPFATTFALRPGVKWQDTEIEIWRGVEDAPTWVLGVGITGSIRGINFDDYRPELIVCDDVVDEENASTDEQRNKLEDLFFGAVFNSLAPSTDAMFTKLALLQTPLHPEDLLAKCSRNPLFRHVSIPCWTDETKDLPPEQQESRWPERWTSKELRALKAAAVNTGKYHVFAREREVKLISALSTPLRANMLKRFEDMPPQIDSLVIACDPVPPPSPSQVAKDLHGKDWEVWVAVAVSNGEYYVLEDIRNRGHQPTWSVDTFFRLGTTFRMQGLSPVFIVEAIAYQRTLKSLLEMAMVQRQLYFTLVEFPDRRAKHDRILDGLQEPVNLGAVHIRQDMLAMAGDIANYPKIAHDDGVDALSMAILYAQRMGLSRQAIGADGKPARRFRVVRGAP